LVERRDEDEVRAEIGFDEPPRDFEARETGHLHIEKNQVRLELSDEPQGIYSVGRLGDDVGSSHLA
jgi:hypothetical protein